MIDSEAQPGPRKPNAFILRAGVGDFAVHRVNPRQRAQNDRRTIAFALGALVAGLLGCTLRLEVSCRDDSGCSSGSVCQQSSCVPCASCAVDAGSTWTDLAGSGAGGGVSAHNDSVSCKGIALTSSGRLYVGWRDASSGRENIFLRYWDGNAWGSLGGSGDGTGISQRSGAVGSGATCFGGVAFDSQERPYVTYFQSLLDSTQPTYLKFWDGAQWSELAGSATGGGLSAGNTSFWPKVAVDALDRVLVTWEKAAEVYLLRYESGAWGGLAGSDTYAGELSGNHLGNVPVLQVDSLSRPSVSFLSPWSGPAEVYFTAFNGIAWAGLGSSASSGGLSSTGNTTLDHDMVLDSADRPIVGWTEDRGASQVIHVRRWDGSGWQDLGDSTLTAAGVAGDHCKNIALSLGPSGSLVASWDEEPTSGEWEIKLARWAGDEWRGLPSPRTAAATTFSYPETAIDSTGAVYVVWEQQINATQSEIYLRVLR